MTQSSWQWKRKRMHSITTDLRALASIAMLVSSLRGEHD